MKKLLLILLCLPMIGFGQSVPQGINYQAVARDANGDVLMNQALTIQFSVISDVTTSAVSWQETHTVTTNDYGLYTAIIGQGTSTSVGSSATFDVIDWGASNHLLKVEVDYGGGLIDMGTTAFMSIPYAFSSEKSKDNLWKDSGVGILEPTNNYQHMGKYYNNKVNFAGYDYTGGTNIIGTPTARNRVIFDLEAGAAQYGNSVPDGGSVIQTLGGIKILPLCTVVIAAEKKFLACVKNPSTVFAACAAPFGISMPIL